MRAPLVAHDLVAFGGARCELIAVVPRSGVLEAAAADIRAFEAALSRFRPDSELSRFNGLAGRRAAVTPLLEELLRTALDCWELSGGLVNAAVLPALAAAGYDADIARVRSRGGGGGAGTEGAPVPALPEVLEVGSGWGRLAPGCAIDLGGIGKGWLADRLGERLGNAAVNLGGDLRLCGPGADGEGWRVAVCDGRHLFLTDAGVATSGVTGRHWRGGHHLIDPRTGRPAATSLAAVSVAAAGTLRAETLAKTAVLLGLPAATAPVSAAGGRIVAAVDLPGGWELAS